MINIEQFQNENDLVKIDDNCIHSICTVNRGNEKDVDTNISGTGEYNLHLTVFKRKHRKFTGRSFHLDSTSKYSVMTFKDQKKRVENHVRGEVTPPVIMNRMLEKEPENAWDLLDKHLNTVRDNNSIPLSVWCRSSSKLVPTVSGSNSSDE